MSPCDDNVNRERWFTYRCCEHYASDSSVASYLDANTALNWTYKLTCIKSYYADQLTDYARLPANFVAQR